MKTEHQGLRWYGAVCILGALLALPAHAQNPPPPASKVFGLIGITASQTARLHFVNISKAGSPPTPVLVELQILDSAGQPLLHGDLQPLPTLVQPGETASLKLLGEGLSYPDGANSLLIQPRVQLLQPVDADGIATFELEDSTSTLKFAVRLETVALLARVVPLPWLSLGPVSLQADETARLNLVVTSQGDRRGRGRTAAVPQCYRDDDRRGCERPFARGRECVY
jgi:hypothetical protein